MWIHAPIVAPRSTETVSHRKRSPNRKKLAPIAGRYLRGCEHMNEPVDRSGQPFGGYHRLLEAREDVELTHVGPRTPCGEYMRRFWQPVAMSAQIRDLPIVVKLLGEELVLFRDPAVASGSCTSTAATAGRRSSTASLRSTASAAATTAGSSTSTAASSRRPASPKTVRSGTRSAMAPIRRMNTRA